MKRAERLHEMRQADGDSHRHQLGLVFRQLRLGPSSERLLWFIHQQVIQARSSVIKTADSALAAAVWGRKRDHWPRQWRQDLASMLKGLTWLHLGQGPPSGTPSWGMNTALVTHAADLRNDPEEDTCAGACPETVSVGHHHFLINVGRGFLGLLEQFGRIDVDGPEAHAALLSHLGKEPVAPKAISGSRNPYRYHLFFRCPDCSTKAKAAPWHPQLEFRGKGGIVVIPPSLHKSGNRYEWAADRSPADLPFPEVPSPILAALQKKNPLRQEASIRLSEGLVVSPSTRRFLSGVDAEGPQWNERLFQAACDLAGRKVPQETATALLLAGARPWNESERDNALRTIGSAYGQPRVPGTA